MIFRNHTNYREILDTIFTFDFNNRYDKIIKGWMKNLDQNQGENQRSSKVLQN